MKAPTGSGKTLAYLAPIVNDLQAQQPRVSRGEGTHALIIVPTRELCIQIADILTLILRRYIWLVRTLASIPCWLPLYTYPTTQPCYTDSCHGHQILPAICFSCLKDLQQASDGHNRRLILGKCVAEVENSCLAGRWEGR